MIYEKELRMRALIVMLHHLEMIKDSAFFTVGEAAKIMKVSKPTARLRLNSLVENGKMDFMILAGDDKKTRRYFIRYTMLTEKDWERARQAYQDLLHEMSR